MRRAAYRDSGVARKRAGSHSGAAGIGRSSCGMDGYLPPLLPAGEPEVAAI